MTVPGLEGPSHDRASGARQAGAIPSRDGDRAAGRRARVGDDRAGAPIASAWRLALHGLAGLAVALAAPAAVSGEADVISATAERTGEAWRVSATVRHADEGWDHHADAWRVVGPSGEIYGVRELLHPHVSEQPFTRSLSGVAIPEGVSRIRVEARDSVHGWGGATVELDLPR